MRRPRKVGLPDPPFGGGACGSGFETKRDYRQFVSLFRVAFLHILDQRECYVWYTSGMLIVHMAGATDLTEQCWAALLQQKEGAWVWGSNIELL